MTLNGTNLDVDPSAYDSLAVGQAAIIEYSYDIEDGNGGSVSQTATITINGAEEVRPSQQVVPTAGFVFVDQSEVFSVDADAFPNSNADTTFTATTADGGSLPDWLTFDPTTLTFTGVPDGDDVGSIRIVVTATDAGGQQTTAEFPIVVADGAMIDGTMDSDQITGTAFGDVLTGFAGGDTISGGDGDDLIRAGDELFRVNFLNGDDGNDVIEGNAGQDFIRDGDGDDIAFGGDGSDVFTVGAGQNILFGGDGNDFILAQVSGSDNVIFGGDGSDEIILGRNAGAVIDAGAGDDFIQLDYIGPRLPNLDPYVITLGAGRDTISSTTSFNLDDIREQRVTDFETGTGGDVIDFDDLAPAIPNYDGASNPFGQFVRLEQDGNDTLFQINANGGNGSPNFLTWLRLENTQATDFAPENFQPAYDPQGGPVPPDQNIVGDDTDEFIIAGVSNDTIDGQGGRDVIRADAGDDTVFGASGNDIISGGLGEDNLDGGIGNDTLNAVSYTHLTLPTILLV